MSNTDRRIIETYSNLFEGLSFTNKIELIKSLSKSLKTEKTKQENKFYKSFGAFASSKSAEELVLEIKESRKFRKREINF